MSESEPLRVARGWNGNLRVLDDGVAITRGFKGLHTRKRRGPDVKLLFDEITGLRFLPATRLVGYLQFLTEKSDGEPSGYLVTIRDDLTVTFTRRHAGEWTTVAADIAKLSGVELESVGDLPDYWGTVRAAAPTVGFHPDRIRAEPIRWGSGDDDRKPRPSEDDAR
jgi:hypothetical protein